MRPSNVVQRKSSSSVIILWCSFFLLVAGGILLAMLVTVSTIVDNRFRATHHGGSIGFTSMLIIVRFPWSRFCSFVYFCFPLDFMK